MWLKCTVSASKQNSIDKMAVSLFWHQIYFLMHLCIGQLLQYVHTSLVFIMWFSWRFLHCTFLVVFLYILPNLLLFQTICLSNMQNILSTSSSNTFYQRSFISGTHIHIMNFYWYYWYLHKINFWNWHTFPSFYSIGIVPIITFSEKVCSLVIVMHYLIPIFTNFTLSNLNTQI